MEIIRDQIRAKMYWGAAPYPAGSECIGVICRTKINKGALLLLASGEYVQGNGLSFRTLDQRQIEKALVAPV
jgi:hypothetical protein